MKKGREKPLQLPILVRAEDKVPDGFLGANGAGEAVRRVEPGEIIQWDKSGSIFRGEDKKLWVGLGRMKAAYRRLDNATLREATEMVRAWIPGSGNPGLTHAEPDEKTRERARWDYSSLVSNALSDARLVVWWVAGDERLLAPAVFCPNWETAAFAHLWAGSVRLCPNCNRPFVPTGSQEYFPARAGLHIAQLRR